jgi:hypothetical protein
MRSLLQHLKPGTRFRLDELGTMGVLVKANECRAVVRLDAPVETVEFVDGHGAQREFVRCRTHETSWSPNVLVTPLEWEELTMAKKAASKKTTKAAPAKKATKAAADKPANAKTERAPKADGKLSQLDAAVKVLEESKEPMTTKAMVEAMAAKGYWSSPGGQTPAATLYSAILRELQKKGAEARFEKVERGQFVLRVSGVKAAPSKKEAKTKRAKKGDAAKTAATTEAAN